MNDGSNMVAAFKTSVYTSGESENEMSDDEGEGDEANDIEEEEKNEIDDDIEQVRAVA